MIPDWMRPQCETVPGVAAPGVPAATKPGRRTRHSFLRRALKQFAQLIAQDLAAEHTAELPGFLQGVDARAKLLGMAGLLVAVTLLTNPALSAAVVVLCLILAIASRLPLKTVAQAWLLVPLFTVALIAPAVLNVVTPGAPVAHLWTFGPGAHLGPYSLPAELTITQPGLFVASRFVLRVLACMSLVLIIAATTRPTVLLTSLRSFGVPKIFVMVLAMMYRYVALLVRTAEELHLARMSREITAGATGAEQRWVASGIGFIFRRSRRLGEEVYRAMVSRGYEGEARRLRPQPLRWRDGLYIAASSVAVCALLVLDRVWQ
jgi:cobalt/nickel transport system permease protein